MDIEECYLLPLATVLLTIVVCASICGEFLLTILVDCDHFIGALTTLGAILIATLATILPTIATFFLRAHKMTCQSGCLLHYPDASIKA